MALKFNNHIIQNGIAQGFPLAFSGSTIIRLYTSAVAYPATSVTTVPTGQAWSGTIDNLVRSNGRVYHDGLAITANSSLTGTITWAAIYAFVDSSNRYMFTDSVSTTDPTAVILLDTLSAVSGSPLTMYSLSFVLAGS